MVQQFQHVNDLVPGVLEAVEAELGDCVLEAAVGLHLHLDLVVGDHRGGLGKGLELGLLDLLLDLLDLLLFLEDGRRGWQH